MILLIAFWWHKNYGKFAFFTNRKIEGLVRTMPPGVQPCSRRRRSSGTQAAQAQEHSSGQKARSYASLMIFVHFFCYEKTKVINKTRLFTRFKWLGLGPLTVLLYYACTLYILCDTIQCIQGHSKQSNVKCRITFRKCCEIETQRYMFHITSYHHHYNLQGNQIMNPI